MLLLRTWSSLWVMFSVGTLPLVLGINKAQQQPNANAKAEMRIPFEMPNASSVDDDTVIVHPEELLSLQSLSTPSSWLERLAAAPLLRGVSSSSSLASTTIAADERYYGTQRVLAVRVTSVATGEYPTETLDEMQAAIFGNRTGSSSGSGRKNASTTWSLSNSCTTQQFRAVSHGQLNYVPARHEQLRAPGLLELDVTVPDTLSLFDHVYWQTELVPILHQTLARRLLNATNMPNNMAIPTIRSVADRVLFCMPTGSLRAGTGGVAGIGGMVRSCVCVYVLGTLLLLTLCAQTVRSLAFLLACLCSFPTINTVAAPSFKS
jgi:hypothetical protein